MKKLLEILKAHKHAIYWTIGYGIIMYLILNLLFGFDMLSARHWSILLRAHLRGFSGFVFGILILAAIPMYIATTTLIIRTKKPIFTLFPKKIEEKKEEKPENPKPEIEEIALPAGLPTELRGAFIRAKSNMSALPTNPSQTPPSPAPSAQQTPIPEHQTDSALPLPDDFDFGGAAPETINAPMFREISFDEPVPPVSNTMSQTSDDITIKDSRAIATHDDPDFWIADEPNWFATGKQKKSPIKKLIAAATEHNAQPELHLITENIMDLNDKITEWKSQGIKIIRNTTTG
jgi:hypothetical protein